MVPCSLAKAFGDLVLAHGQCRSPDLGVSGFQERTRLRAENLRRRFPKAPKAGGGECGQGCGNEGLVLVGSPFCNGEVVFLLEPRNQLILGYHDTLILR